jgi:hypothetical protein
VSTDYYMICPHCNQYAQIFRYTAGGFNPPNGLKVHDFFLEHSSHAGFVPVVREQEELHDQAIEEEWQLFDTYGEGREAKPFTRER